MQPLEVLLADTDLMWQAVLTTIDGLTTEEFFWEPVAGCWSLRAAPGGGYVQDWMPAPPVPPFTTIAWRLAHIGQSLASHAARVFGQGSFSYDTYRPAGSVEGERAFLEASFASWRAGIEHSGADLDARLVSEVLSFNHHHLGHAKEIDTIRQLFRAGQPPHDDPVVAACLLGDADTVRALLDDEEQRHRALLHDPELVTTSAAMGHWRVVTTLLDLGWPAEGTADPTALHLAAAFATPEVVRTLIEHGADTSRRDPEWHATPRGWAEFYGNRQTADQFS